MELQKIQAEIIKNLEGWRSENVLVVGLDGYSGIGKTTLCKSIAEGYSGVKKVNMDNFVTTANSKECLMPQIENKSPTLILGWKPFDGVSKLRQVIESFRDKPTEGRVLLVEGIFLFHPALNDLWDKRIYLDGDFKRADERRMVREKERWGDGYMSETDPDSYARLFKIAYERYLELYQPEEMVDLVLKID